MKSSIYFMLSGSKGVTSMGFTAIICAMIIVLTLYIVFPALHNWNNKMNEATSLKEADRLRRAINGIHAMGDVGSIEKITLILPPGYCINVVGSSLQVRREEQGSEGAKSLGEIPLDTSVQVNINWGASAQYQDRICGTMTIELIYEKLNDISSLWSRGEGKFQIFVGA